MVLCVLPMYCDLLPIKKRLNYDVMNRRDEATDILSTMMRPPIHDYPIVPMSHSRRHIQPKRTIQDTKKKVKNYIKAGKSRSNVQARKIKSRHLVPPSVLKSKKRLVHKPKVEIVQTKARRPVKPMKDERLTEVSKSTLTQAKIYQEKTKLPAKRINKYYGKKQPVHITNNSN